MYDLQRHAAPVQGTKGFHGQFVDAVRTLAAAHDQHREEPRLKDAGVLAFTMVGGAVVTPEYAEKIGADVYGRDALEAVARIRELLVVPGRQRV